MKNIFIYALIFVFVFLVPTLVLHYFKQADAEQFNKWVNEDNETCYQRAKRDSVDKDWCNEIRNATKLTYNSAVNSSNTNLVLMLFQPILFVLIIKVANLRKQIEELKKSEDS
ncbi:MAG TPA: hypothetical protein PKE69_02230 [Pyrinomonadaceae bacterium]|nr:hypothetical protein [Pyrinomonadaceae bacterium]